MKKLEELIGLEKKSEVEIPRCDFISDHSDAEANIRYRILKDGERYFFHKMKDGEVVECYELALSWEPFKNVYIFSYTPDDRHIYEIDSRALNCRNIMKLTSKQIHEGDFCEYNGHKLTYVNADFICFDGKVIPVMQDSKCTYMLMKTKIKAIGGARGLYIFLENIAERGRVEKFPLFCHVWEMMARKYN